MIRPALLLLASSALFAVASDPLAATTGDEPTTCVIDGMVFDECPLGDDQPPWGGGGSGHLPVTKPDLGARGGGFAVFPSCLSPGRQFDAHAVIENFGGLDFAGDNVVQIDFYLVPPNSVAFAAANLLGSIEIVFPEVTSASFGQVGVLVSLSGDLPDIAPGQYKLGIEIDVGNRLSELVEGNNKIFAGDIVAVGDCIDLAPALDGSSVTSPVTPGDTLTIASNVRNEGDAALVGPQSFQVRYRAVPEGGDELGGTVLGVATVSVAAGAALSPGAARQVPPLSLELELPPGNYSIAADVDFDAAGSEGAVEESDEQNNSRLIGSVEVNTGSPKQPDYFFTLAKVADQEKDPISAGFRLAVAIRLGDTGSSTKPGYYPELRIVASRDKVIDARDFTLRDFPAAKSLFTFGPGASLSRLVTLEVPWPAELPAGTYTIGAIVDPREQVAELNENNNTALVGGVQAVVDCTHLATLEDAQAVFQEVFTGTAPLPVQPATHPALNGELCEECFTCDLNLFTTEVDVCRFDFRYKLANTSIEFFLRPMMHQACVTSLAGLVTARPSVVLEVYKDAKEFKEKLASDKAFCDSWQADSLQRRYCGCSNTQYLNWAASPYPGQCVYSP
jgi:hypothetical protein